MSIEIKRTLRVAGEKLISKLAKFPVRKGAHRNAQAMLPEIVPARSPKMDALLGEMKQELKARQHADAAPLTARVTGQDETDAANRPEASKPTGGSKSGNRVTNPIARAYNAIVEATTSQARLEKNGRRAAESLKRANEALPEGQAAKRRAELDAKLPVGVTVDAKGKIHGDFTVTEHSRSVKNKVVMVENNAYCAGVIDRNLARLAMFHANNGADEQTAANAEDKLITTKAADGQHYIIYQPALKDMARFENINFVCDDKIILTREELVQATQAEPAGDERGMARASLITAHLASLCNKDQDGHLTEAGQRQLVALTSIYVQGTIGRGLLSCQAKETGASVILISAPKADCVMQDGKLMARYFDENGQSRLKPLEANMGGASINITRQGDQIIFETEIRNDIQKIEMQDLPHMQGHSVSVAAKTRISLDLSALGEGRNGLTYDPIAITVNGHMPQA